jgi:hypothetical protein
MAQQITQKVVNTFIRGLVTEAGELTFPPDASVDELNCALRRDGTRERRLAVEFEDGFSLSTFNVGTSALVSTGFWDNVGGINGLEYLVVQVGPKLYFYNKASAPFSSGEVAESINLLPFEATGTVGAAEAKCQFCSINGALVVASAGINTIYLRRDNDTGAITAEQIKFRTRDFEWQGDFTTYTTEGANTPIRRYDTLNSGWTTATLSTYGSQLPPLTHPWFSGKDANDEFSKSEWEKIYGGSSLMGNGHFILDFFNKNRSEASGVTGLPTAIERSRFKSVVNFAGRVFYAGLESEKNSGRVLFSRIIEGFNELGECLQSNDPTSEFFNSLLDTDGGEIVIQEAVNIQRLHVFGSSILVFADNGIWQITGIDDVFRATGYAVSKITRVGILSPESFVEAEGIPFWWSKNGIHTLSFDSDSGKAVEQNISISTIQRYWDEIPNSDKRQVIAEYDSVNKRIFWAYPKEDESLVNKYNKFLILDIPLQAFYPWEISDQLNQTSYVVGVSFYSGYASDFADVNVVNGDGDNVETSVGEEVVVNRKVDLSLADSFIVLLVRDGVSGKLTMALFSGDSFRDWGNANYETFVEAGFEFFGDLFLKKTAPYVITYCRATEEGWQGNEITGYDPLKASSLFISTFWDFNKNPVTPPQQVYRLKPIPVANSANLSDFGNPSTVVTSRLKVRGKGRSMRIRFDAEAGKGFILLGYGVLGGINARF